MNQNNLEIDREIAEQIEYVMEKEGNVYPKAIEDKLAENGFDEKEVRRTLAKLRRLGYVVPTENQKGRVRLTGRFTES